MPIYKSGSRSMHCPVEQWFFGWIDFISKNFLDTIHLICMLLRTEYIKTCAIFLPPIYVYVREQYLLNLRYYYIWMSILKHLYFANLCKQCQINWSIILSIVLKNLYYTYNKKTSNSIIIEWVNSSHIIWILNF